MKPHKLITIGLVLLLGLCFTFPVDARVVRDNQVTFHTLLTSDDRDFENVVEEALDSSLLDDIKKRLSNNGVNHIYIVLADVPFPQFAKTSLVSSVAESAEFKDVFDIDIPVGSYMIRIFAPFKSRDISERISTLEHELWHLYQLSFNKDYFFKMADRYHQLSAVVQTNFEANWFLFLEESRRVQLQIREGASEIAKRDAEDDLQLMKKEAELLISEKPRLEKAALLFFIHYINIGISGFEMADEVEFTGSLKGKLKKIYRGYIGDRVIRNIKKGPIAYIQNNILSKGPYYVPTAEECHQVMQELYSAIGK